LAGGHCTADDRTTDDATGNCGAERALSAGRGRGERTGDCCDRKERSKCLLHVLDSPEGCGARVSANVGKLKMIRTPSLEFTPGILPYRRRSAQRPTKVNVFEDIRSKNGFFRPLFPSAFEIRRN
jgi:hypothetical protein